MPQILEFSFRNVCSYGNKIQKIPFGTEPKLMLITGENGAGKTTIGNALEFSWYGKTRKRRLKEFANRLNGHLETYNKFLTDDGRVVEISRGIDPAHFDLKVDGEFDNKAGKTKIDEYIANELIGMPFEVCTNVQILSINDFKSFVKISAEDKRKIVDRIFGMDVLNKMNVILKEDLKQAKIDLNEVEFLINHQNTLLSQNEGQLNELKQNLSDEADKRKLELEKLIDELTASINKQTNEAIALEAEIEALAAEFTAKQNEITAQYSDAENAAIAESMQAEIFCDTESAKECAVIEKELQGVLATYATQYGETIGKLTSEVNEATAKLKQAMDAKIAAADKSYAAEVQTATSEYDKKALDADNAMAAAKTRAEESNKEGVRAISIEYEAELKQWHAHSDETERLKTDVITLGLVNDGLNEKIQLYNNNVCPECETDLTTHFHANRKDEFQKKVNENLLLIKAHNDTLIAVSAMSTECQGRIDKLSERSEALEKWYDDAVKAAETQNMSTKTTARQELNDKKLKLLEKSGTEKTKAQTEYNTAYALDVTGKNGTIQQQKHQLELSTQDAGTLYGNNKANVKTKYANLLAEKKQSISEKKNNLNKEILERSNEINGVYNSALSTKRQDAAVLRSKAQSEQALVTLHKQELADINAKLADNFSVRSLEQTIAGIREQMIPLLADQATHSNKIKLCLATQDLLTEDGIKKTFMNLILPTMNATIAHIIKEFQYKFPFHFDQDFNAVIEHMGHEISAESLSTGEEKMIDIIVVLAVMELIKLQHPKINVMFLDEIFASLDQNNIEKTIKILRDFINKYKMTLFAISHTMMPKEHFDNIISVTNDGMFSDLSVA